MNYFKEHFNELPSLSFSDVSSGYRECQLGAIWATFAHFTSSNSPALISMPTGSGKTALMMLLSFFLRADRVIVVEPVVILRSQTASKFSDLKDLEKAGLYSNKEKPIVEEIRGKVATTDQWKCLAEKDVVVATPHTISPEYNGVMEPPKGILTHETILFIDEAHHSAAITWKKLIECFGKCKIILLTATPFRNDRRRLLAKLIYHYPLRKAIDASIYSRIEYHNVFPNGDENKDYRLAEAAKQIYEEQSSKHPDARLLVRAEGILHSEELVQIYKKVGLKVGEVNYKKTLAENKDNLDRLKIGELHGIVCVNQIGEGLDLPKLKIAVLHKPGQSFPATIQFVGRICRETDLDAGQPQLIACSDDVKGQLRQLYLRENAWHDLIPDLIEKIVEGVRTRFSFHEFGDIESVLDISPEQLEPFFSARVFRSESMADLDFGKKTEFDEMVKVSLREITCGRRLLALVTEKESNIPWASTTDVQSLSYDLHVYYNPDQTSFIFEHTTCESIASKIRHSIAGNDLIRLESYEIVNALGRKQSQYLMVGLSGLIKSSGSVPTYKTYMGDGVENAIKITDRRVFSAGHALARYSTGETRGVACYQGRVWSIQRGSLEKFADWCDQIANCMNGNLRNKIPGIETLSAGSDIVQFPSKPFFVYSFWNPNFMLKIADEKNRDSQIHSIGFSSINLKDKSKKMTGTLTICHSNGEEKTKFEYGLAHPYWVFESNMPRINLEKGDSEISLDLKGFLCDNPPTIFLSSGGIVRSATYYESPSELSLDGEVLDTSRDWSECDIFVEFRDKAKGIEPLPGFLSVHEQLEKWLLNEAYKTQRIVIRDHAKNEIADYVVVDPKDKSFTFYHCKACTIEKRPGARINELKALEQALRSINYVGSNSILSLLTERVKGNKRKGTVIKKGKTKSLEKICADFRGIEWTYEIVIVSPGLDCSRSLKNPNTRALLASCSEWLENVGAKFRVTGIESSSAQYGGKGTKDKKTDQKGK